MGTHENRKGDLDMESVVEYSFDEVANNYRAAMTPKKDIEWFSGEDPCFNCNNLVNKVRNASRSDIFKCLAWLACLILAILVIYAWFSF